MVLHFNLCGVFLFSVMLMLWQALFSHTLGGASIFFAAYLWLRYAQKKLSVVDGVFAGAYLLNLWYVLSSWGNVRQYDYFNFFMQADYFLKNQFFIFNPLSYLQSVYFQPPLWGAVSALITKIMMFLGQTAENGFDYVRFISLFAVSGSWIIFLRLCEKLHFSEKVCLLLFSTFALLPINGIMANLVNNDAAVYFLMLGMVYAAVCWSEDFSWKNALSLSLLLLLAPMIKFSGLMVVPALAVLWLFKLLTVQKKMYARFFWQAFAVCLCAVTGFFWGWFLLYHHLPLTPPPINNEFQNMSDFSLADRLFSVKYWLVLFADIRAGQLEPNVWLALIKTFLFGEWAWSGNLWGYILYLWGAFLAFCFILSFCFLGKYKCGRDYTLNAFFVVLVFSVLGAWINFWLDYPYFCSTEFRYVIILMPAAFLWSGCFLEQKKLPKTGYAALAVSTIIMVVARFMLYLNTI